MIDDVHLLAIRTPMPALQGGQIWKRFGFSVKRWRRNADANVRCVWHGGGCGYRHVDYGFGRCGVFEEAGLVSWPSFTFKSSDR